MSLDIQTYSVGPLETNCYLISDTRTLESALIDPGGPIRELGLGTGGSSEPPLSEGIGYIIEYVLLTHGHPDHCFYAGEAARDYRAAIAMHAADIEQIEQGLDIAAMFYDVSKFVAFSPTILLNDGDQLRLGDSTIEVMHLPGHSRGGLGFVTAEGVFCGDTIFAGSIGRTDFPGGSYEELISSIRSRILTLKDETRLYPGHGPATTVGRERKSNPFLT